MGEIDRGFAPGRGELLEEGLRLHPVARPPVAKPALQRPRLPGLKWVRAALAQQLQHDLGFEYA